MIHSSAEVHSEDIGKMTRIWQFVVVLKDAQIGSNCNINSHVFIENDVIIGNNVTIKSGVQLWDGVRLKDNVFIGPNVTFTNDLIPRSKRYPSEFLSTIVEKGASIGANATILAGNTIGQYSLVGAGSVITKSIGRNEVWVGNPAKHIGYVTNMGIRLNLDLLSTAGGERYLWQNGKLKKDD